MPYIFIFMFIYYLYIMAIVYIMVINTYIIYNMAITRGLYFRHEFVHMSFFPLEQSSNHQALLSPGVHKVCVPWNFSFLRLSVNK